MRLKNLIRIFWENPLGTWKKHGKPYFRIPYPKLDAYVMSKSDRRYYHGAALIDIVGVDMLWKTKYSMEEFEECPRITVTLFNILVIEMSLVAPKVKGDAEDICYWEGMLTMMSNDSIPKEDALLKAYEENQWDKFISSDKMGTPYEMSKPYTIEPYLTNLGWHVLQSKKTASQKAHSCCTQHDTQTL